MKKIRKMISKLLTVLILFSTVSIVEASGMSVSPSQSQVKPGGKVSFTIRPPANHGADVVFSVSNGTVSGLEGCNGNKCVILAGGSAKVTVTAGSSGNVSLNTSGSKVKLGEKKSTSVSGGASVKVVQNTPSSSKPDLPNPGVDDPSRLDRRKPQQKEETEAERKARLEREKKQAEERKKKEEERKKQELEEKKKTPLVTEIEIFSQSEKMNGESLKKISTKKDVFSYEYILPRRIDKFEIKPVASKDVKLDFVKVHTLEGDKKEVVIKAESGEIKQDIKLVVKKNEEKFLDKKVEDQNYQVYEDELLDRFMKNYGYEAKKDDKAGKYFSKEKINLQMLIDQDVNVRWVMLDKSLAVKDFVSPVFLKDQIFFVTEAPEEMKDQTLYNEKYQTTQREVLKDFLNIDPELKFSYDYKSWPFDEGELVYGFDENLDEGVYHLKDNTIKSAVVAFDGENLTWKRVAMVSGFAFLGLASANAANYYKKRRRV